MNHGKAKLLLQVDNLQKSVSFYTRQLGWELVESAPESHAALLRIWLNDEVVLKQRGQLTKQEHERQEAYLTRWLQPKPTSPQAGDLIYIGVSSVNEVEKSLQENGWNELRKEEETGHIRKVFVPADDGYTFVFWEELFASDDEIMKMFADGIVELECAVDGLSDEQLSLTEAPGKWSIREQVLHLIDLELVTIHKVKFALAEPGRTYQGNHFSQDDWSISLHYATRPIAYEVQLFRSLRQHILGLCEHLPGALERTVITTNNREESVARLLKMMSGHARHHVRAVERIRELHGY
ncbi:catechol 2,3-dioxygenase-like lactoylglutathione lyase family enzyme [Paenibacillus sp. V4I3]|uniref:DinB family protein n=1 Tax=unclassified Paenibacillus TaxID=185978 RepID=UPI002785A6C0|nr:MULTISPECIES: DinB family protein [unclassified Paenibacillus]MDQ0871697.1 catechol 2,3-dioxygenase-like lactoylglutathione lyase family enzyme [Paenibacillus sp. V4I3]MDQ0892417.1 catechol 2,3-dioxygenase-like lactoylglutathione lyase family enzyme [Paenibacillus sp. V4I9]